MGGESIYKRKDGRFEGRIYSSSAGGKRCYKSYYGSTYEEARKKMRVAKDTTNYSVTEMTVRDMFAEWFSVMKSRLKESTLSNYRMKANKHIIPVFGDINCCELDHRTIYDFIERSLNMGLSARYVSDMISLLRCVYKYAEREYNLKNIVSGVIMPRKSMSNVKILSDGEQDILKKYIAGDHSLTGLGIAISLYTGIRIGELCALKWEDVDLEKRIMTVRHTVQRIQCFNSTQRTKVMISEPKSLSSKRVIPIPKCLCRIMKKFSEDSNYYILSGKCTPIEPRVMQYRFSKILKNAGLPSVHFHSLRHAFATKCIALGFDVKTLSEILGHSCVELTLNRYVHSSIERKFACMDMIK